MSTPQQVRERMAKYGVNPAQPAYRGPAGDRWYVHVMDR